MCQLLPMDYLRFLRVSGTLQSVKAKSIVVGFDARDWLLKAWRTGPRVPAGTVVIWTQFFISDGPARVDQPWPWDEIDRIEWQTNATPKIGGSPKLAGDCYTHVVMNARSDNFCFGKFLNKGIRRSST